MINRRRLVLWFSLIAVMVPVAIGLFVSRGLVLEIKASAATPPLMADADELAPAITLPLPVAGDVLVNGGMGAGRALFSTIAGAEYYNPLKRAFFLTGGMPVKAAAQGVTVGLFIAGCQDRGLRRDQRRVTCQHQPAQIRRHSARRRRDL